MKCPSCSATLPDDSMFCGKCGYRVTPEPTPSLDERLSRLEQQMVAESEMNRTEQRFLERETAENVMARVRHWTNLILFFAGIPAVIMLLSLAVIFGKADFDLNRIAANAKGSVTAVLK